MKILPSEPRFDVASVLNRGHRDYQEDSLVTDFPLGSEMGFAVLADGMGGHAAGDMASKIIVTEVYSELKFQSSSIERFTEELPDTLVNAAISANECIQAHVAQSPKDKGMGSTLVSPIFIGDRLWWVSVGDSPFYLFRGGKLKQLNEDHSMAPQIDLMLLNGEIDEETARTHPDRNALTSVLSGGDIPRIDCPKKPFEVRKGDIYIVSSDGLQFLTNEAIAAIVAENVKEPSSVIATKLMNAIAELDDPDQDNISFSVIRVNRTEADTAQANFVLNRAALGLGVVNG